MQRAELEVCFTSCWITCGMWGTQGIHLTTENIKTPFREDDPRWWPSFATLQSRSCCNTIIVSVGAMYY